MVTADGTYATQSALVSSALKNSSLTVEKPILRKLLLEGNFFVAAALGNNLSKLIYRFADLNSGNELEKSFVNFKHLVIFTGNLVAINKLAGEACLIISSIIYFGKSGLCKTNITEDDLDRLSTTLRAIINQWPGVASIFINDCREALNDMLVAKGDSDRHEDGTKSKKQKIIQAKFS